MRLLLFLSLISVRILCFSQAHEGHNNLEIAGIFGDHMVIQRDVTIPIWGWAKPNVEVTVSLGDSIQIIKSDQYGKWEVIYTPRAAGGPISLSVSDRSKNILLTDIYFGDVWLCSGQSNMEMQVYRTKDAKKEVLSANDNFIRHVKIPHSSSIKKQEHFDDKIEDWKPTNPQNVEMFTGVGYYFARELRKSLDIPIGLVNSSSGGTTIERWMSTESLEPFDTVNEYSNSLAKNKKTKYERYHKLKKRYPHLKLDVPESETSHDNQFLNSTFAIDTWDTLTTLDSYFDQGYGNFAGVAWLRKDFALFDDQVQSKVILDLDVFKDNVLNIWINGVSITETTDQSAIFPNHIIDKTTIRKGTNTLVIKLSITEGQFLGAKNERTPGIITDAELIELQENWCFKLDSYNPRFESRVIRSDLYNEMIHPLTKFPIKGILWYQGEANRFSPDEAYEYRSKFTNLICDWRAKWGQGDIPFLFVQLANFDSKNNPYQEYWEIIRSSQSQALELPNTAQVVTIDIGNAHDIHPRNKQDVGKRLSLCALKMAYETEIIYSGPDYQSYHIKNNKVLVSFDSKSSLITTRNGSEVLGFTIAGKDRIFHPAKAKIKGDNVIVFSKVVKKPLAVRYAWENNPEHANMINKEGLPMAPFKTDNWPSIDR